MVDGSKLDLGAHWAMQWSDLSQQERIDIRVSATMRACQEHKLGTPNEWQVKKLGRRVKESEPKVVEKKAGHVAYNRKQSVPPPLSSSAPLHTASNQTVLLFSLSSLFLCSRVRSHSPPCSRVRSDYRQVMGRVEVIQRSNDRDDIYEGEVLKAAARESVILWSAPCSAGVKHAASKWATANYQKHNLPPTTVPHICLPVSSSCS